jgi:hypothetical protein
MPKTRVEAANKTISARDYRIKQFEEEMVGLKEQIAAGNGK